MFTRFKFQLYEPFHDQQVFQVSADFVLVSFHGIVGSVQAYFVAVSPQFRVKEFSHGLNMDNHVNRNVALCTDCPDQITRKRIGNVLANVFDQQQPVSVVFQNEAQRLRHFRKCHALSVVLKNGNPFGEWAGYFGIGGNLRKLDQTNVRKFLVSVIFPNISKLVVYIKDQHLSSLLGLGGSQIICNLAKCLKGLSNTFSPRHHDQFCFSPFVRHWRLI
ncbi:hypothetical protein D3C80_1296540 [compost metagenome]